MKDDIDGFSYGKVPDLTDRFLNTLTADLDGPGIQGIALGGSYARGDATHYSDVDIALFMREDVDVPPRRFFARRDKVVSVSAKVPSAIRKEIERPERAIWVVRGLAACRILIDKTRAVSELLSELRAFQWEPLQPAADRYAARYMALYAEAALKILGALQRNDNSAIANATHTLVSLMTEIVAVQRGVMIESDHTYYRQVQESAGLDSVWTSYHNIAIGVTPLDVPSSNALAMRALSSLHLYRETLSLVKLTMTREQIEVAQQVVRYTGARTGEQRDF
jgi:predicted nucleotidyltransferase